MLSAREMDVLNILWKSKNPMTSQILEIGKKE